MYDSKNAGIGKTPEYDRMHMVNKAFVNTGFLSTWVFGLQELEEQRNAKKHGKIK